MHFYMDVVHSLTRHVVRRCVHRRVLLHQCLLVCEQRHTLGFQLQIIHCRLFPLPSPTSHRCSGERTPAARFRNRSVSRREGQSTHRRGLSGEVAPSGIAAGVGAGWSPENPPALRMRPDVGAAVAQQVEIEIDDGAEPHALARARRALESADERMPLRNLFSPVHVVRAGPGLPLVAGRSRRVPQQYGGRVWTQALVRNGVQGCADGSAGGQTISCPGPDRDTAHASRTRAPPPPALCRFGRTRHATHRSDRRSSWVCRREQRLQETCVTLAVQSSTWQEYRKMSTDRSGAGRPG